MWFVYRCLTDGGKDVLRWPALSGYWLSCMGCWLYLLVKWWMCGTLFRHISTSLWCFCSRTIFTKRRIGQVTSDLLYMRFTYYTKDNHQGCSRLSNWFAFLCLGPWLNHFPHVRWSTLRFRFLIFSWYERLTWWRAIFSLFLAFSHVLYITQVLSIIIPLALIYCQIAFCTKYFVLTCSTDVVSPLSHFVYP